MAGPPPRLQGWAVEQVDGEVAARLGVAARPRHRRRRRGEELRQAVERVARGRARAARTAITPGARGRLVTAAQPSCARTARARARRARRARRRAARRADPRRPRLGGAAAARALAVAASPRAHAIDRAGVVVGHVDRAVGTLGDVDRAPDHVARRCSKPVRKSRSAIAPSGAPSAATRPCSRPSSCGSTSRAARRARRRAAPAGASALRTKVMPSGALCARKPCAGGIDAAISRLVPRAEVRDRARDRRSRTASRRSRPASIAVQLAGREVVAEQVAAVVGRVELVGAGLPVEADASCAARSRRSPRPLPSGRKRSIAARRGSSSSHTLQLEPTRHVHPAVGSEAQRARPVVAAVRQPVDDALELAASSRRVAASKRIRPIAVGLGDVEPAVVAGRGRAAARGPRAAARRPSARPSPSRSRSSSRTRPLRGVLTQQVAARA